MAAVNGNIETPSGRIACLIAQFIINDEQQICCIGFDGIIDAEAIKVPIDETTEVFHMGTLNDLGTVMQIQLSNSLQGDGWNFIRYGNPECFMLTKKQTTKIIVKG